MELALFPVLAWVLIVFGYLADGAQYCFVNNNNNVKYCETDCCEDDCCGLSTGDIIGIAIGGAIFLIMFISCIVCVICMFKKTKHRVQPIHNSNSVYVNNTPYSHPPPSAPPPRYSQYNSYPPPTSSSFNRYDNDMAYPPGAVSNPPPYTSRKY